MTFFENNWSYFVGNKAKGQISKRVFQENKTRQIFRRKEYFETPDTHTYFTGFG